jgi:hypothetical protein
MEAVLTQREDDDMRYWLRCMLSGLLLIAWSVTSVLILPTQAREQGDLIREVEAAWLAKSLEDTLVFSVEENKGTGLRKGRLSEETSILDEKDKPLNAEALEVGSVWAIKLLYPYEEKGLPLILEMKRIRQRPPK